MSESRPLRAYAEVVLGRQRAPQHEHGSNMLPYLRAANVKDGLLDLGDIKEMNFSPSEQEVFALQPGDVLVSEGSGSLGAVGASAVWTGEIPGPVCFQNTLLRLRPRPGTLSGFLAWWCRHAFADGIFASVATGANIFHVSAERVRDLPVNYLPIDQQRGIADFLDDETVRIDALIGKKGRLQLLLEQRRSSLLEDSLRRRGINLPESVQGASTTNLPDGWKFLTLGRLLRQLTNGYVGPTRDILVSDGIRYIQGMNIKRGEIDFSRRTFYVRPSWHSERPRISLHGGDVLIVQTGDIGQVAVVPHGFGPASCHALLIARPDHTRVSSDFLGVYLQSMIGRSELLRRATGALHPHLEFGIRDAPILVPPPQEQAALVEEVRKARLSIDAVQERMTRQASLLHERRRALITAAVTGHLHPIGTFA